MIHPPLNDRGCLDAITEIARRLVAERDPELTALAHELGSPIAVIRWLRSLPQRDDTGVPDDGPRVDACAPPQRLRLPAPDPNCIERATLFVILAELLDPRPARRLATIDTPAGRHTLPVEDDRPVVLDPRVPRNCARSGVDVLAATPPPPDLAGAAAWVCQVAAEPADRLPGGPRRLGRAHTALAAMTRGEPIEPGIAEDVATVLALAAREAPQWGPAGVAVVDRVARAVLELDRAVRRARGDDPARRNAAELRLGRHRLRPAVPRALGAALRALGVVGSEAGAAVVRAKLATLGLTPDALGVLESELAKEGLSLGPLARPAPPPHSIAALTKQALVARHLERAGAG